MTIKNLKWNDEGIGYSITGTVINKSPREQDLVSVFAILYDANNNIINIKNGMSDVMNLKPGGESAFKVIFSPKPELPDHHTLIPGQNLLHDETVVSKNRVACLSKDIGLA